MTTTPVGDWAPYANGQLRITSVAPIKDLYQEGDVVTVRYRMESNETAPARDLDASSTTLANADSCDWANFPAGTAGKYDCARTGGFPAVTYTVTAEDAVAGEAVFDMTWTETPLAGGEPVVTTLYGSLPVSTTAVEPSEYLSVSLARTDSLGDPVRVGDTLTYSVTYTNLSDQAITAFPRSSNLDGTLTTGTPNCRWASLAAGATQTCTTASHTVTAEDVSAGSFTGTVTFDATLEREGTTVLQAGIVASAPPVAISDAPAPPREEGEYTTLATPNYAGFACHRIPALTQAPNGWLLASWDGRPGHCGDAPQPNSIVQRISKDGGQTWENAEVIAAGEVAAPQHGYSDPSYIVDRETGRVFVMFVLSYDVGWHQAHDLTDPRKVMHAAVIHSDDNGQTWSEPRNTTAELDAQTEGDTQFTKFFATSGEGIQLRYGTYAGRLIQQFAFAHTDGTFAFSAYSDDHGETWHTGEKVGPGMDENKTVELSDGRVMLNSRAPGTGARLITISEDGGQTWGPLHIDRQLTDPTNNASITRAYPNAAEGTPQARMLLFSNADSASSRSNGTVRLSYDDGQTWATSKVFEPGSMSYSTLTPLAYGPEAQGGVYGLLFEGTSSTIRYMQVSLDWLGGLPLAITAAEQTVGRGDNTVTFSLNLGSSDLTVGLTAGVPAGWAATASEATVTAGATQDVDVAVPVPHWADAGPAEITLRATADAGESTGVAALTVELAEGQNPSQPVELSLVGTLPAQPGEGAEMMFDGDLATLWHTPWNAAAELPLDIDLTVGEVPAEVSFLTVTPRQNGSNGRIAQYEVYAGDSLESLTKVGEGTMANTAEPKLIPVEASATFVRLRVLSSYGDTVNKFVSVAELSGHAAVADTPAPGGKQTGREWMEANCEGYATIGECRVDLWAPGQQNKPQR